MTRFKDLLIESDEYLKELSRLLKTQFRNDLPQLLFRSTGRGIGGEPFQVRMVEKHRSSIGSNLAQVVLDKMAEERYENVPKRSEAKFASSPSKLGHFGKYDLLVFPEKNANIVSFIIDTLPHRNNLKNAINFVVDFIYNHEIFQSTGRYEALYDLYVAKHGSKNLKAFIQKNWPKVMEDLLNLKKDGQLFDKVEEKTSKDIQKKISKKIDRILNPKYFRKMKMGFHEDSAEVIFDGKEYLYVDPEFFKNNFKWNGAKWRIKDEV